MDNKVILDTFGATALGNQIRWVCWKKVPKDNGGFTKPPIDPKTGKTVDIRTPEGRKQNCMTLDVAIAARVFGECDGIGVVTGEIEGTPLCGIDIDHCLVDGKPKPEFAEAVTMVATHGYCEISPSGEGVRGFVLARKPKGYRERRGGVEVYDSGQYVTVTGNRPAWAQEPLGEGLEAVQWLCDTYLKDEPSPQREAPSAAPVAFNWQERVDIAKQYDATFSGLWNGNRPSGDESADDLGLCNKLAYYLDKDPAAIEAAFLASPYTMWKDPEHQKKLERKDYLRNTIAKAVRECADTYSEKQERYQAGRVTSAREAFGVPIEDRVHTAQESKAPTVAEIEAVDAPELMETHFSTLFYPVFNLICEGLTMLVGASKIGKSWAVLAMAVKIARGEDFWGRPTTKCTVLYMALEDSLRRIQNRLRTLGETNPPENLFITTKAQMMATGFEKQVDVWFEKHPGKNVIIIDTFQKARGISRPGVSAYQDDYDVVGRLKALADKHHAAIIGVHHTNKLRSVDVDDPFEKVSGSTGIMGAADTLILIDKKRESDNAIVYVEGRDVKGKPFEIRFVDGRWELENNDAKANLEKAGYEASPIVQLFRKLMAENPQGGRWTYEKLKAIGLECLGYYPFMDGRDLRKKLQNFDLGVKLRKNDGILVEAGVKMANGNGVKLNPVKPMTTFQTKIDEDLPQSGTSTISTISTKEDGESGKDGVNGESGSSTFKEKDDNSPPCGPGRRQK